MITTRGAILPPDMQARIAAGDADYTDEASYDVPRGVRLREVITASWNTLRPLWENFRQQLADLDGESLNPTNASKDPVGTLVQNAFLFPLLKELGFGKPTPARFVIDDKHYPITHRWHHVPIHLPGRVDLDHRSPTSESSTGGSGGIPHNLVQELLNRDGDCLWAIVASDTRFRLLRDNLALSRPSYVEFDLAAIFDDQNFADFAMLYRLAHVTRFGNPLSDTPETGYSAAAQANLDNPQETAPAPGIAPESVLAPLEVWSRAAHELGTRLLEDLRVGVKQAIEYLGTGFYAHPQNAALRQALTSGELTPKAYYQELLQLIYRLLFLFVAEDRDLLHTLNASPKAKAAYFDHYATQRLRTMADRFRGTRHDDLYRAHALITAALGTDTGLRELALPGLGSWLFDPKSTCHLTPSEGEPAALANRHFLAAIRALAYVQKDQITRKVDYRNLGSEELGSVYESLLELEPQLDPANRTFTLTTIAGNDRKTSGSYYTPDSLVQCLLDTALEPVVKERCAGKPHAEREDIILDLKVCDPACGSGHFLIAAAHRLARHLARARSSGEEADQPTYRHALRDIICRCLYGVDINPMAVQLCKVALWIESLEPGAPLTFLDSHVLVGNALLGTTPRLMAEGIPDEAFKPIAGDDKKNATLYKKRHRTEKKASAGARGQTNFLGQLRDRFPIELGNLPQTFAALEGESAESVQDVKDQERRYGDAVHSSAYLNARFAADAWCAAFVWKKDRSDTDGWDAITEDTYASLTANPHSQAPWLHEEVQRLAGQYRFFHWHLAFPHIFRLPTRNEREQSAQQHQGDEWAATDNPQAGWYGGFDIIIGNPPWERTAFEEVPYFQALIPEVAAAETTAIRQQLIANIPQSHPEMWASYQESRRHTEGIDHFLSHCGRFHLSSGGRTNTFALFTDLSLALCNSQGILGYVIPTAIATDVPYKQFWSYILDSKGLSSLFDFENQGVYFPQVHRSYKFCLITVRSRPVAGLLSRFGFFLQDISSLDSPASIVTLPRDDIALINPLTKLIPVCRTNRDFELLLKLHKAGQITETFARPWVGLTSASSSDHWVFNEHEESHFGTDLIAMHEAKCIHHFNHRFATFEGTDLRAKRNGNARKFTSSELVKPHQTTVPRYLCPRVLAENHLDGKQTYTTAIGAYRDVARSTDERTMIPSIVPMSSLMQPLNGISTSCLNDLLWLVACLSSFPLDYACRLKTSGTHVNVTICRQLPIVLGKGACTHLNPRYLSQFVYSRVIELTFTAWDLEAFAQDCGYDGPPFIWDDNRRFEIRAELDAAFFHLYGLSRDDTSYILDTFPIVKRKDEAAHGTYRTKNRILELYDQMATATADAPFETTLNPPPGPLRQTDGTYLSMAEWDPNAWPGHIHTPRDQAVTHQTFTTVDNDARRERMRLENEHRGKRIRHVLLILKAADAWCNLDAIDFAESLLSDPGLHDLFDAGAGNTTTIDVSDWNPSLIAMDWAEELLHLVSQQLIEQQGTGSSATFRIASSGLTQLESSTIDEINSAQSVLQTMIAFRDRDNLRAQLDLIHERELTVSANAGV